MSARRAPRNALRARACALAFVLCAGAGIGCSVDANANSAYGKACANGLRSYKGFCVDAGWRDGSALSPASHTSDASNSSVDDTAGAGGATPSASGGAAAAHGASGHQPANAGASGGNSGGNPPDVPDAAGPAPAPGASDPQCNGKAGPQPESCNGLDDDCDGRTDEDTNVPCADGNAGCSPASDGTFACKGICRAGVKHCQQGVLETACGGQVLPGAQELCGAPTAADDDCNGSTDETCVCGQGDTQQCYSGPANTMDVGTCKHGMQACAGGTFGACVNEVGPTAETCKNEGQDDDCNKTQDDVPMRGSACTTSAQGQCRIGTLQCDSGELRCRTPSPVAETCNTLDDDCDGMVDEGLLQDTNNCGVCGQHCDAGQACCAGRCVDRMGDSRNCGACGHACPGTGSLCCTGRCVEPQGDTANCGACAHACSANELCCTGDCVSKISDNHCGSCSNSCSSLQTCCPSAKCGILDALGICL